MSLRSNPGSDLVEIASHSATSDRLWPPSISAGSRRVNGGRYAALLLLIAGNSGVSISERAIKVCPGYEMLGTPELAGSFRLLDLRVDLVLACVPSCGCG